MKKVEELKSEHEGFYRCYRNIGIIGSFGKHMNEIKHAKQIFEREGFNVLVPKDTEISDERSLDGFLVLENDDDKRPRDLEKDYLNALCNCQVVYVCDKDGYIGKSAMFEIGYLVYTRKCDIIFQEMPNEELIVDMMTDKDGVIQNIMSPIEVCKSMKRSNYFSFLNSKKYLPGDIPSEALYQAGAPMEEFSEEETSQKQPLAD